MARPVYPFNPEGTKSDAVVYDEVQVLTPENGKNYVTIVPRCAPFFRNTLKITNKETGKELVEHVDYEVGYMFNEFTVLTYKGIYGCITFLNINTATTVELEYATLGWNFVLDEVDYAEIIANIVNNPRTEKWENIVDLPDTYPPFDHVHSAPDLYSFEDFIDTFRAMVDKLTVQNNQVILALQNHIKNNQNPHDTTAELVKLGLLDNFATATIKDLPNSGDNLYVTLSLVKKALELYRYPSPLLNIDDELRAADIVEASQVVNLLRAYSDGGLLTTDETTNYAQWKYYYAYLLVDKDIWPTLGKATPSKPSRNEAFSRLLGQ